VGAYIQELVRTSLYKRNQGRIARQITAAAVAIVIAIGAWCLSQWFDGHTEVSWMTQEWAKYGVPVALALFGGWAAYRLVNVPAFADFLISVEAEMNKVSWPSRHELVKASIVVLCVIFFLAFTLYIYDLFWRQLLELLNVVGDS